MKIISITSILLVAGFLSGCTSSRSVGRINGVDITRITARGVFSPSSTTLIGSDPSKPGEIEVLANASGPGLIPAIATAGGVVGGAVLLRPARTSVNASPVNTATGNAAGGNGQFVPPGHINNPSQNH